MDSHEDKPATRYKRTCQVSYTTFLSELQQDSDDEEIIMKPGAKIVFPFRAGAHFSIFIVKYRNTEDIEKVKRVRSNFERIHCS